MTFIDDGLVWKQHFPTYDFKDRDVVLEEYKFATKLLEIEERIFLNAANLSLIFGTALGSLTLGSLDKIVNAVVPIIPETATLSLILFLVGMFGTLSLRYFAERQKSIVFAARKVIVLRRMLGMNYGHLQLVLPNWRIEGADEPFAIRLFPGWNTYVSYPCYAISGISFAVVFFILSEVFKNLLKDNEIAILFTPQYLIFGFSALWFVVLSWIYRKALLDTHERASLLSTKWLAKLLNLKLVDNFEYIIYRSILAMHEMHRQGINLTTAKKLLVHIEDKEFYTHSGVSIKGLCRMILSVMGCYRRSGGSTITQQLVRTLFIIDKKKLIRRKIIEILLARWFNNVIEKSDQLELYLASVRYDANVFGIVAAMKHFLGEIKSSISSAEAFFLIERISNVRSKLLVEKIDQTLHRLVVSEILNPNEVFEVLNLYSASVNRKNITDSDGDGIERLKNAWKQLYDS